MAGSCVIHAVVDTSALESFLVAAGKASPGTIDPVTAWAGYERDHREVFARYFDGWGDPQHRSAAAAAMVQAAEGLAASGQDWRELIDDVAARMTGLVPGDLEIPVVVFVGMGTSNGWVTRLGGRATVFLAAEVAAPPPFDAVVAAHELTHAAQHLLDPAWEATDYPIGSHAFAEGLGTYLSAVAYPGHADDEYLWVDSTHHQWLRDCEQAWPTAAAALLQVLDEPCGGAAERRFFAARPVGEENDAVPARFGYYAGWRIVRDLAPEFTAVDLLTLDVPTAQQLIRRRLDNGHGPAAQPSR